MKNTIKLQTTDPSEHVSYTLNGIFGYTDKVNSDFCAEDQTEKAFGEDYGAAAKAIMDRLVEGVK